jgi:hypothetical protein
MFKTNIRFLATKINCIKVFKCHNEAYQSEKTYSFLSKAKLLTYHGIINDCPIAVSVGDVVECAASLIT